MQQPFLEAANCGCLTTHLRMCFNVAEEVASCKLVRGPPSEYESKARCAYFTAEEDLLPSRTNLFPSVSCLVWLWCMLRLSWKEAPQVRPKKKVLPGAK